MEPEDTIRNSSATEEPQNTGLGKKVAKSVAGAVAGAAAGVGVRMGLGAILDNEAKAADGEGENLEGRIPANEAASAGNSSDLASGIRNAAHDAIDSSVESRAEASSEAAPVQNEVLAGDDDDDIEVEVVDTEDVEPEILTTITPGDLMVDVENDNVEILNNPTQTGNDISAEELMVDIAEDHSILNAPAPAPEVLLADADVEVVPADDENLAVAVEYADDFNTTGAELAYNEDLAVVDEPSDLSQNLNAAVGDAMHETVGLAVEPVHVEEPIQVDAPVPVDDPALSAIDPNSGMPDFVNDANVDSFLG